MDEAGRYQPPVDRYVLFLDILGFSDLVERKPADEIYGLIDSALQSFVRWEELNARFRTIYFSDTFVLYQESPGYHSAYFHDVYAIGGMLLSALLAMGIPARGAISFGEFQVARDASGRHQVFFGRALIEAFRAEQQEKWIGITILKSAWLPYEQEDAGRIAVLEGEGVWIKRQDDVLLLNPFLKLRSWYPMDELGEIPRPYLEWDAPEFPNDLLGFKFLRDQSAAFIEAGDFWGPVAVKYHSTIAFLRRVLGSEVYEWGSQASEIT